MVKTDSRTGTAGKLFTAYQLTIKGFDVSFAEESLGYDLVLDFYGKLKRIQAKARRKPEGNYYSYSGCGLWQQGKLINSGISSYKDRVDLMAYVQLDKENIIYQCASSLPDKEQTHKISIFEANQSGSDSSWEKILQAWHAEIPINEIPIKESIKKDEKNEATKFLINYGKQSEDKDLT